MISLFFYFQYGAMNFVKSSLLNRDNFALSAFRPPQLSEADYRLASSALLTPPLSERSVGKEAISIYL